MQQPADLLASTLKAKLKQNTWTQDSGDRFE